MKNCKSIHNKLLIENNTNLFCKEIKFLSIRSLTLTTEVSIRIVTINASIRIANFLLLNTFLYSLCTLIVCTEVKHNLFVAGHSYTIGDRLREVSRCIAIFAGLILVLSITTSPVSASSSVNIFPPGSKPYGLTYADHAKDFWKWTLKIPASENPVNDPTGEKCAAGQSSTNSSVFYLSFNNGGKSLPERICNVPAGKGLLIPVMQVAITDKDIPGASVEELDTATKKDQDSVNSLYLRIGDKEHSYDDLLKYRTHTDAFDVVWADKAIFGIIDGGPAKAVADGFYILTEPLRNGSYPVHFKSSLICPDPDCADPNFVQDIQYTIIAE